MCGAANPIHEQCVDISKYTIVHDFGITTFGMSRGIGKRLSQTDVIQYVQWFNLNYTTILSWMQCTLYLYQNDFRCILIWPISAVKLVSHIIFGATHNQCNAMPSELTCNRCDTLHLAVYTLWQSMVIVKCLHKLRYHFGIAVPPFVCPQNIKDLIVDVMHRRCQSHALSYMQTFIS